MTQPALDFTAETSLPSSPATYTQRVAELFTANPGRWLDGLEIAKVAGQYAWRSRISDARRAYGLVIENRQRRIGKRIISEYRWISHD